MSPVSTAQSSRPLRGMESMQAVVLMRTRWRSLKEVTDVISRQIHSNQDVNLFFRDLEQAITIDEGFKHTILELKHQGEADIHELAHTTARAAITRFFTINQFIHPSLDDRKALEHIYFETYSMLDEHNFEQAMQSHFERLAAWIARLYPDRFVQLLSREPCIGGVIDNEYTVEFQSTVLGFHLDALQEPILDIGCGSNAYLVRELIRKHKRVIGIDRLIESPDERLIETDWFDFEFRREYWGTIIANMSFTNHLQYAVEQNTYDIRAYYLTYKEIIESLAEGGCFYYAPSVNFIEQRLSEDYSCERTSIHGVGVTKVTRIAHTPQQ